MKKLILVTLMALSASACVSTQTTSNLTTVATNDNIQLSYATENEMLIDELF
jgi:hypothetical protein